MEAGGSAASGESLVVRAPDGITDGQPRPGDSRGISCSGSQRQLSAVTIRATVSVRHVSTKKEMSGFLQS